MLFFSGSQLRNHRVGLKIGNKWTCKTLELFKNENQSSCERLWIWQERMGVCEMTVKCTRLCYWIARPAKPRVQIQLHQSNDCMQQHYDITQFEYILWRHTMHEWVINIHYKIKLESPKGDSQTQSSPPRNNGACVIILKNSTIGFIIFICHTVSS